VINLHGAVLFPTQVKVDVFKLLLDKTDRKDLLCLLRGGKDEVDRVVADACDWIAAERNLEDLLKIVKKVEAENLTCCQTDN